MPIVTLTTDLGIKDNYLALVKAYLLKEAQDLQIIDISNEIDKYNIQQAGYIFGNAFKNFPAGTVHVLGVKSAAIVNKRSLLIELNEQFILCPDNGIISIIDEFNEAKVNLVNAVDFPHSTFYVRDTLCKAALSLINKNTIAEEANDYLQSLTFQPTSGGDSIVGKCIYIDSYGNVITNIKKDYFEASRKGRRFTIHLPSIRIEEIVENYDDVSASEALALFNSAGHLEIAINRGAARQLLFPRNMHMHTDFNITVEFE